MPQNPKRKRIAIVGGGCAAMAAAWDLTSDHNPNKCEVTVFQIGGRLGGKGASSRNQEEGYRHRIEEHGLHLWLGYYENAFRMIRSCFKELQNDPGYAGSSGPFDHWNWQSAFERANLVGLADDSSGDWVPWVARFPEYVHVDEEGVTGSYYLPDGSVRPGVHLVDDEARAYPGEEPRRAAADACDSGEDVCLERPNVAFFLTHALRELRAFLDSLEVRVNQIVRQKAGSPSLDPDELMREALTDLRPSDTGPIESAADMPRLLRRIRLLVLVPLVEALSTIARIVEGPVPYLNKPLVAMLDQCVDELRERIERFVHRDIVARRLWELIDLLAANIRGIIAAGLEGADDFSSLDKWNYIDWLRMNRIAERTLNNPLIRGAHDLGFAYRDGNPNDPQIGAGQAISAGCRFFFMYKGALFWRMKAGMGDVVFAPMYLALRNRGVEFRFFHRLDEIQLDEEGQAVAALKFSRQVSLKQEPYEPLVTIDGMPCWPRTPLISQFDDATRDEYDRLEKEDEQNVNFESIWCNWPHGQDVIVKVGAGADSEFDAVIVTVPVAALGRVSKQMAASRYRNVGARWQAMLDNLGTVATQSMQLWVNKATRDLGWKHGQVSFSAFVHPFDTWADLSHLIEVERPGGNEVRGVHYFCSALAERQIPRRLKQLESYDRLGIERTDPIAVVHDTVRENARYFLEEWIYQLWPDAVHRYPTAFKWTVLVDPEGRRGADRLEAQHIVANVDPSERYSLSLPGTTQYRLPPDEEVVPGLYVAGDWTDSGLNIGCVEAAVMSGRLAAFGISGYPDKRLIPGFCRRSDRVIEMQGGY